MFSVNYYMTDDQYAVLVERADIKPSQSARIFHKMSPFAAEEMANTGTTTLEIGVEGQGQPKKVEIGMDDITISCVEYADGDNQTKSRGINRRDLRAEIEAALSSASSVYDDEDGNPERNIGLMAHFRKVLQNFDRLDGVVVSDKRKSEISESPLVVSSPAKCGRSVACESADIVMGDVISWQEGVSETFEGKSKLLGWRTCRASVVGETYTMDLAGRCRVLSLAVRQSGGFRPVDTESVITRDDHTLSMNVSRLRWVSESDRKKVVENMPGNPKPAQTPEKIQPADPLQAVQQ